MDSGRTVRWDAAREPLAAVLDGTNPFAFQEVLGAMAATGIEPALGRQLIREAPDLLLAHVGAEHETTREAAIDLLKTVSGEDFGADSEAWSEWLSGRPQSSESPPKLEAAMCDFARAPKRPMGPRGSHDQGSG